MFDINKANFEFLDNIMIKLLISSILNGKNKNNMN